MRFPAPFEEADLIRGRIELERRTFAVEQRCPGAVRQRSKLHHHGNAARSRQHRDVTHGTAAKQRQAAAARPIDFQKPRRRQIFSADNRAIRNFNNRSVAAA